MASWGEFEAAAPELAAKGREMLYQFGTGLGFLATVRADGGPRMHPVCPIITGGGLYVFVVAMSPKRGDLLRDGRYALHCFPPAEGDGEFYLTGRARPNPDRGLRARVVEATGGRLGQHDFEELFEFDIEHVLHTTWTNPGQPDTMPAYTKWHAPGR